MLLAGYPETHVVLKFFTMKKASTSLQQSRLHDTRAVSFLRYVLALTLCGVASGGVGAFMILFLRVCVWIFFGVWDDSFMHVLSAAPATRRVLAVIAGAGFIGLEIAENLKKEGLDITIIDMASNIMPNAFDDEMASWARKQLENAGIRVLTSLRLEAINGGEKAVSITTDKAEIQADMVILALGVRPSTSFLKNTSIEMEKGAILVGPDMKTSVEDVYAAGDCALVTNRITGKRMYSAMGSTANITARILAENIAGKAASYPGAAGTGVVKLLDNLNAGRTGLTEEAAKNCACCH